MNLFSGLEQFGVTAEDNEEIFGNIDLGSDKNADYLTSKKTEGTADERTFLYEKVCQCTICDKKFKTLVIRNSRLRRLQPDNDLRPRFVSIDTLKYDVISCPRCGYSALSRYFGGLTRGQVQLVKDKICNSFKPQPDTLPEFYDYPTAILRTKMALYTAIVKKGKASERAYACLKISWMMRDYIEELKSDGSASAEKIAEMEQERDAFYKEAYEGFKMASVNESLPICGMDGNTLDFLMAYIAAYFKDYAFASKSLSNLLTSKTADNRIKNRALDLKDMIVAELRKNAKQ